MAKGAPGSVDVLVTYASTNRTDVDLKGKPDRPACVRSTPSARWSSCCSTPTTRNRLLRHARRSADRRGARQARSDDQERRRPDVRAGIRRVRSGRRAVAGFTCGRHAGLLLPLFSAPSRRSWGIGELADLPIRRRLDPASAGLDFLQVLPLNEMAVDDQSPYAALSAMAIDPIYVAVHQIPDFEAQGGEAALAPGRAAAACRGARVTADCLPRDPGAQARSAACRLRAIPATSSGCRGRAGHGSCAPTWIASAHGSTTTRCSARCTSRRASARGGSGPRRWPDANSARCGRRAPRWPASTLPRLRPMAGRHPVARRAPCSRTGRVFGDLPFMVGADSADVWANQHAFRRDATIGAPPMRSATRARTGGCRCTAGRSSPRRTTRGFARARAATAALFDGYRIDHVVGFYRTYRHSVPTAARRRSRPRRGSTSCRRASGS